MMKTEKNPSREEIVRLLAKASDCRVLSSDRYAQGAFESLCIQRPEGLYNIGQARVSLVQFITVYGADEDSVSVRYIAYVDERDADNPLSGAQIPQYSHSAIKKAGLTPVHEADLPRYYRIGRTEICYRS
jgi:hypothetical protein